MLQSRAAKGMNEMNEWKSEPGKERIENVIHYSLVPFCFVRARKQGWKSRQNCIVRYKELMEVEQIVCELEFGSSPWI
jgi:hypothetical protein